MAENTNVIRTLVSEDARTFHETSNNFVKKFMSNDGQSRERRRGERIKLKENERVRA